MSGWHPADKYIDEGNYDSFPSANNITMYGQLPSDQVPSGSKFYLNLSVSSEVQDFDGSPHEKLAPLP